MPFVTNVMLLYRCVIVFINSISLEHLLKFVGTVFTAIPFSHKTQKLSSRNAYHLPQASTQWVM